METTLYIQNLKCGGCANTITKNLTSIEGIENITVHVEESAVSFTYSNESQLTTTKERLNGILAYKGLPRIRQVDGQWYWNNGEAFLSGSSIR